jgi:hypothetical protein
MRLKYYHLFECGKTKAQETHTPNCDAWERAWHRPQQPSTGQGLCIEPTLGFRFPDF